MDAVRTIRPVCVGCSGWQYRQWSGIFYPPELPQRLRLEYYATRFETVEVNNSFYKLPTKGRMTDWRNRVPDDFRFAVKASRYLTHMKRLQTPEAPLEPALRTCPGIDTKAGPGSYISCLHSCIRTSKGSSHS